MIFKRKKNIPLKTSKPMMTTPIHINDKILIPIHCLDMEVLDLKFPNLFGKIESKGVVVVTNDENKFLSSDDTLTLKNLIDNIPELEEVLTKNK